MSGEAWAMIIVGLLTFSGGVIGAVYGYRAHVRVAEIETGARQIAAIQADVAATREAIGTPNGKGDVLAQMARLWDLNDKVDTHQALVLGRLDRTDGRLDRVTERVDHLALTTREIANGVAEHLREHSS